MIFVDMDGIVVDLLSKWLAVYNEEYGDRLQVSDLREFDNHQTKAGDAFYDIFRRPGFFDDLEPLPGAIDSVRRLQRKHEVVICSSPAGPDSSRAKHAWCNQYLPGVGLILTKRKDLLAAPGRTIIDDNPVTLAKWHRRGGATYTISYPYNECATFAHRIDCYKDTQKAWHEICKKLL